MFVLVEVNKKYKSYRIVGKNEDESVLYKLIEYIKSCQEEYKRIYKDLVELKFDFNEYHYSVHNLNSIDRVSGLNEFQQKYINENYLNEEQEEENEEETEEQE